MKILDKLYAFALGSLLLTGCEAGVVYEDVPESIYENVELSADLATITSRELFKDKVYALGWSKWVPDYLAVSTIGNYQKEADYTNKGTAAITILGQTVAPGATVKVKNQMTIVDDASAPEGKLYVLDLLADRIARYATPSNNYVFDASKFSGDFQLVDDQGKPVTQTRSVYIKMPVKEKEIVIALLQSDVNTCKVEPINGAPTLGIPGDYTNPQKYLVTNITRRPDGKPAKTRMYEIRLHLLP